MSSVALSVKPAGRTSRLVAYTPFELKEIAASLPGAVWDKQVRAWTYPATIGTAATVHRAFAAQGMGEVARDESIDSMLAWAKSAAAARPLRIAEELDNVPSRVYLEGDRIEPPRFDIQWICQQCGDEFTARDELPPCPSCGAGVAIMSAGLHQRRAFYWAIEQEAAILEMGMGSGKSKVAVDLVNHWGSRKVLILSPKSMIGGWSKQFRLHSMNPFRVTRGEVYKRNGDPKVTAKPIERIEAIEALISEADVLDSNLAITVNYELAWREPFREWILGQKWDCVILDEGHRCRAPGGKQGLFAAALRDVSLGIDGGRRLELTGTSMPHSPLDLYGQCRYIEPALFGTSYAKFKVKYGKPRVKYVDRDVGPDGELIERPVYLTDAGGNIVVDGVLDEVRDEIAENLARVSFTVSADEALTLPTPDDEVIEVVLDSKTSKAYRDLDNELVAEIGEGICTVDNALTRFLRLAQITSGHLPIEVPCQWCAGNGEPCTHCESTGVTERVETIGTDKRDALSELLEGLPTHRIDPVTFEPVRHEPVVTFARFTPDLLSIQQATESSKRGPYKELSGSRSDALTSESTLEPETGVAGIQIQSGAEGVDFTLSRIAVYFAQSFSLGLNDQSRARLRRPGSDLAEKILYRHLIAVLDDGTPTIDQHAFDAVQERREVVDYVHERMRERAGGKVAA